MGGVGGGGGGLLGEGNLRSDFWGFKPFSKLILAVCEYLTSIKIKIKMTCVSKEYEIKTKMKQE